MVLDHAMFAGVVVEVWFEEVKRRVQVA